MTHEYNARGYLSKLKHGATALVTVAETDAWGNATRETYGNGVSTARTLDAATGRVTGISTTRGTATFQAETYAWRSDGLLGGRTRGTDREAFAYDALGRLESAKTRLDGSMSVGRTLAYGYDALGNLTSKTSDVAGDADAETYTYDGNGVSPTRLLSAVGDVDDRVVRIRACRPPRLAGRGDGRGGNRTARPGARPVRNPPQGGLDGAAAGGGSPDAGGGPGCGPDAGGVHGARDARPHRLRAHERAPLRPARREVHEPRPRGLGALVRTGMEPLLVRGGTAR